MVTNSVRLILPTAAAVLAVLPAPLWAASDTSVVGASVDVMVRDEIGPLDLVFAPALGPGQPRAAPLRLEMQESAWKPVVFIGPETDIAAPVLPATTPERIEDRPIRSADVTENGVPGNSPATESPVQLVARLFTWIGTLFDGPGDTKPALHATTAAQPAPGPETAVIVGAASTTPPPVREGAERPRARVGSRRGDDDIPAGPSFDLVGWLSEFASDDADAIFKTSLETAAQQRPTEQVAEKAGFSRSARTNDAAETKAIAAELEVAEAVVARAEPISAEVVGRLTQEPYPGALMPRSSPPERPKSTAEVAEPVEPMEIETDIGAEPPVVAPAITPSAEEAEYEPLVIYVRGTVPASELYIGEDDRLGRLFDSSDADQKCISRQRGRAQFCQEATDWPATLTDIRGLGAQEADDLIVRYDDTRATHFRTNFPAEQFDELVARLSERLGQPTRTEEVLAPTLGGPKQVNRIAKWVSHEIGERGKSVLEIRSIDDLLWTLPPDPESGVIRLLYEGSQPIFSVVSRSSLRLARARTDN